MMENDAIKQKIGRAKRGQSGVENGAVALKP
jgi:hypothetical protein